MKKVILCWSSGKDSAWTLHALNDNPDYEVVALLTTFTEDYKRVSMHGVREVLVEKQAESAGLPLWKIKIPAICTNAVYEKKMAEAVSQAQELGIQYIAFGDLFLQDIRDYRCKKLMGTGMQPLFPLWKVPTNELSRTMIDGGLQATITCVDTWKIDASFSGMNYTEEFLQKLPDSIDPCGENGEFHSFCFAGPMFRNPIDITVGKQTTRDNFCFTDIF